MSIDTVSIVGVGLIGGSFGLALKKHGFAGRIVGVSSPKTIERALARGAIDEGADAADALSRSDLIFLAQPITRILEQLPEIARMAHPAALVTDAGSTKRAIVERARQVFGSSGARFLGGHPMAGKAGRGVEIADADLFEKAAWVLTPEPVEQLEQPRAAELVDWIGRIGSRVRILDAGEHDRIVAATSHLPQLVSSALAAEVGARLDREEDFDVSGGGLRDMTRLAESPYEMWEGIIRTNSQEINSSLDGFIATLQRFRASLDRGELAGEFAEAQRQRERIEDAGC